LRIPPILGQFLTFMDFTEIQFRSFDFAFALLNTIDAQRRT